MLTFLLRSRTQLSKRDPQSNYLTSVNFDIRFHFDSCQRNVIRKYFDIKYVEIGKRNVGFRSKIDNTTLQNAH